MLKEGKEGSFAREIIGTARMKRTVGWISMCS
jgi:hypothetical protein